MLALTRRALAAALIGIAFAPTAFAQQPPVRIRGEIVKVDGPLFVVKTRDGSSVNVKLADDVRVAALEKASLADVKVDTFMGIGGVPGPDGSIKALSIHIFLPTQRGVIQDRHGPWDGAPGGTMTNAYVESTVAGKEGEVVMVKYKDGEKKVLVTPETAIVRVAKGDKSELKAGSQIFIFQGQKEADDTVLAKALYVGRGLTPAM
jgi:hypothetical protein